MVQPKVSVIIPVYGVEKYIARCARSLFGQTLQ
ncbi:MAG: glycosyltransferase, partial [Prevotella sp.]|nr:glycosyltransferase [Prevotella sp.]